MNPLVRVFWTTHFAVSRCEPVKSSPKVHWRRVPFAAYTAAPHASGGARAGAGAGAGAAGRAETVRTRLTSPPATVRYLCEVASVETWVWYLRLTTRSLAVFAQRPLTSRCRVTSRWALRDSNSLALAVLTDTG